jgi:hypothetical protein
MTAFLEQMDSRYGGIAGWLATHGFTGEDLNLLHAKLCGP